MEETSILKFAAFFSKAVAEIVKASTDIDVHISTTFQKVPNVKISGDIGSFVSFKGDYDGILIMNFSGEAAIEIVTAYLTKMGMPKSEIPIDHTAEDVRNNIGEMVNQIVGKSRNLIEKRYDLISKANIPSVVPISIPIGLVLESSNVSKEDCIRISFSTPSHHRFYIELAMEPVKLIEMR